MTRFLFILILALISTFSVTSFAQDNEALAQKAYKNGMELYEKTEYAKAATMFREAYRLKPSWKLQYNIGQAEAAARRHGLAIMAFQIYVSEGGDEISGQREDEVLEEIGRLNKKVGFLKITAPAGSVIYVDSVIRGTAPLSSKVPVAAGKDHRLVVNKGSKVISDQQVKVWTADTLELTIEEPSEVVPEEEDEEEEPAIPPPPDISSPLVPTGAVLTGLGGAALVAGLFTGFWALSKESQLEKDCPDQTCTSTSDKSRIDKVKTMGTVSTVMYAVGATVATTGIILLIAGKTKERKRAEKLTVAPALAPSFAGLQIEGRF